MRLRWDKDDSLCAMVTDMSIGGFKGLYTGRNGVAKPALTRQPNAQSHQLLLSTCQWKRLAIWEVWTRRIRSGMASIRDTAPDSCRARPILLTGEHRPVEKRSTWYIHVLCCYCCQACSATVGLALLYSRLCCSTVCICPAHSWSAKLLDTAEYMHVSSTGQHS